MSATSPPIRAGEQSALKWYTLHVRSNQERNAARFLADRDVELFLPSYRVRSKRSDRLVMLTKPLFPGYLFTRIDKKSAVRLQVLKAPGAIRIVGFGGALAEVQDDTIESLKILVDNGGDQVRPHPLVQVGKTVRVVAGPFSGATGTLAEARGRKLQLVVELRFLGRAVSVPISPDWVQPAFC